MIDSWLARSLPSMIGEAVIKAITVIIITGTYRVCRYETERISTVDITSAVNTDNAYVTPQELKIISVIMMMVIAGANMGYLWSFVDESLPTISPAMIA